MYFSAIEFKSNIFKSVLVAFTFLSTHIVNAQQESGFPLLKNYTVEEYGSFGNVPCIMQDHNGIMYFGAGEEILSFDGTIWQTITIHGSNITKITSLAQDEGGNVYLGSLNDFGLLTTDPNGETSFKSLNNKKNAPTASINEIVVNENHVYFCGDSLVYVYEIKSATVKTVKTSAGSKLLKINGAIYVSTKDKHLVEVSPKIQKLDFKNVPNSIGVLSVTDQVKILSTRSNGLLKYNLVTEEPPLRIATSNPKFFDQNIIVKSVNYKNEYLILGSLSKGTAVFDKNGRQVAEYNVANTLSDNRINDAFVDKNQNLWLATPNGISKTTVLSDYRFWDAKSGLKSIINDIRDFNGNLYVATNQGGLIVDSVRGVAKIEGLNDQPQNKLLEFKVGQVDKLLICNLNGVYEIIGRSAYPIILKAKSNFFSIVQSKRNPNRIFANTEAGFISFRFEKNRFIEEGIWEGVKGGNFSFEEDDQGDIFVASESIVHVITNQENITKPKSIKVFPADNIKYFYGARRMDDKIVFETSLGLRYYNATTKKIEPFCALGNPYCNGSIFPFLLADFPTATILGTLQGEGSNKVINLLKIDKLPGHKARYQPFRRIPKINSLYINCFWLDRNQILWIGTSEGLIRYDAKKDFKNYEENFSCLIKKINIGSDKPEYINGLGSVVGIDAEAKKIEYKKNSITFEYTAPFFDQEEKTKYSFQLEGYDSAWSPWSTRVMSQYNNLHEGNYRFLVKAINIYDLESSIASYRFVIMPPWYRTWWAYSLFAAGFAATIVGAVAWRTNALVKQRNVLEKKVMERTEELKKSNDSLAVSEQNLIVKNHDLKNAIEELSASNEELSATLDELQTTQKQLIEAEKMASLGQLTAGIAHEINNPLNYISGGIQALDQIHQYLLKAGKQLTDIDVERSREEIAELMTSISSGVKRVTRIVKSLHVLASNESDVDPASSMNVTECIENALTLLSGKILFAGIRVERKYTHKSNAIGSLPQIREAILNILDNAIFAVEKNQGNKLITITTEETSENIIIKIRDNGSGIPDEYQNQILNPFFTTKDVGQGTGLGLSISYGIIKKYSGQLTFTSKAGEGSEFVISIPKVSKTV